ncbi:MAG: hypothetical protein P8103_07260 [Candidatus Thiodiazotropha sp.]
MKGTYTYLPMLLAGLLAAIESFAGNPDIVDVKAACPEKGYCNFSVTLSHADEGWDHYADRWEVLDPDGEILGTRTLLHPHVHEQPFTRSLSQIAIPDGLERVFVRAHDSVHGYGGKKIEVQLPSR